jgi:hypothetical protein
VQSLSQMFRDVGPIPNLLVPALFGAFGLAVVWLIQKQIQRRRLRKREQFLQAVGESVLAKIPQKISFEEITAHSWSNPSKYEESKAAFESLHFSRTLTFQASPQEWVAEFWLSSKPGLFAKIIDSKKRGVYSEVTVMNRDGVAVSFENTEECGLKHREPNKWVHCGLTTPAQLVERALQQSQPNDDLQMNLAECVSADERSVNEYLAWRRSVGISADEVKQVVEHMKRRRSLET